MSRKQFTQSSHVKTCAGVTIATANSLDRVGSWLVLNVQASVAEIIQCDASRVNGVNAFLLVYCWLLEGRRCLTASEASVARRGEQAVVGVKDEHSEQLRRLGLAGVTANRVERTRRFRPALASPIDARPAIIYLRLDRA